MGKYSSQAVMGLLIISYMLWGGGMAAMKFAFECFTPPQVVFARSGFAAIFYLLIFSMWKNMPYQKGDWLPLGAMVLFEPCLFFFCETFSMRYTTASQGGVIAACFPVCTAIGAWIFLGEKLSARLICAIVLAVLGVAGASWFAAGDARAPNPLLGNLLMGGAVLSSTSYALCARYITRRYSFLAISAIQAIGGAIIFLPLLLLDPLPSRLTFNGVAGLLYMGIGVGIIVYMCFNFALSRLKAGVVALFGNLIPIFTLLFAWLLLGERLTTPQMLFIGLTLLGVLIASLPANKKSG